MKKKIVIFGGNGFLGSEICKLLSQDHNNFQEVICISRHIPTEQCSRITYLSGDALNISDIKKGIKNTHIIINTIGYVSFDPRDTKKLYTYNVKTLENIMSESTNISTLEHFIHISSGAAFGHQDGRFDIQTKPIFSETEKHLLPYSYTKYLADEILEKSSLPYTIVHPPLITSEEKKQRLKIWLSYLPFLIVPEGSNGVIDVKSAAKKIISLTKKQPQKRIIISDQTLVFKDLSSFLGSTKKTFVIPQSLQKIFITLAKILHFFHLPIYPENIFFAFKKRSPQETKIS